MVTHYVYPLALLFFFLSAVTWWGIHTAGKKPQPAWVSPPVTARSSPARGRSPNGSVRHGDDDDNDSEAEVEDAHLLGGETVKAGRGPFSRMKERCAMWLRGDLEDFSGAGPAALQQSSSFHTKGKHVGLTPIRKAVLGWALVIVIMTYIANSANIILHALVKIGWWCGQDVVVCVMS